ncbi:hypothetical protein Scep_005640 [Stephania cephalantha]|uniref:Peptide N-acetyl-beta-D-glucosaminyl asparaginase amidase A N-terminal domain-containing protein n=1 Tax=Stephania cephalantha TaxID=152367 RepID=A0AAP0KUN9_9MAGN
MTSIMHMCCSIFSSLLLFFSFFTSASPIFPPHASPKEYFEVAAPPPAAAQFPSCALHLPQQEFANTTGAPPATILYTPPDDCSGPWSSVVLELVVSCNGTQRHRIAGIWLAGVEILRSSTVQATKAGASWKVQKDVTKYSSLLQLSNVTLTFMLENTVNDVLTGVLHVNASLLYYNDGDEPNFVAVSDGVGGRDAQFDTIASKRPRMKSQFFYEDPADLVIPIADSGVNGFWFKIENQSNSRAKGIQIPRNTYKAVLEIYASAHEDDEFWYTNPPTFYYKTNNLKSKRGNGCFREIFTTIDDLYVGSVSPFPVLYTGALNPLLWSPAVGIGAFDLPTYDLELTPFLGQLLDGETHFFRIGVADSIPYWLVNANLHLWLDSSSDVVEAKTVVYRAPDLDVQRDNQYRKLNSVFKVASSRQIEFSGFVSSSMGNSTTHVTYQFQFQNVIEFQKKGRLLDAEVFIKSRTDVRVVPPREAQLDLKSQATIVRKYPIHVRAMITPGSAFDSYSSKSEVTHEFEEKVEVELEQENYQSTVFNSQDSRGSLRSRGDEKQGILYGSSHVRQSLRVRDRNRCYSQTLSVDDGVIDENQVVDLCASPRLESI